MKFRDILNKMSSKGKKASSGDDISDAEYNEILNLFPRGKYKGFAVSSLSRKGKDEFYVELVDDNGKRVDYVANIKTGKVSPG